MDRVTGTPYLARVHNKTTGRDSLSQRRSHSKGAPASANPSRPSLGIISGSFIPEGVNEERIQRAQSDLTAWGILESDEPVRFTRRFRGALARAALELQAAEREGRAPDGPALRVQVETALQAFLDGVAEAGPEHRAFAVAVHLSSMPEAVRRTLGV